MVDDTDNDTQQRLVHCSSTSIKGLEDDILSCWSNRRRLNDNDAVSQFFRRRQPLEEVILYQLHFTRRRKGEDDER